MTYDTHEATPPSDKEMDLIRTLGNFDDGDFLWLRDTMDEASRELFLLRLPGVRGRRKRKNHGPTFMTTAKRLDWPTSRVQTAATGKGRDTFDRKVAALLSGNVSLARIVLEQIEDGESEHFASGAKGAFETPATPLFRVIYLAGNASNADEAKELCDYLDCFIGMQTDDAQYVNGTVRSDAPGSIRGLFRHTCRILSRHARGIPAEVFCVEQMLRLRRRELLSSTVPTDDLLPKIEAIDAYLEVAHQATGLWPSSGGLILPGANFPLLRCQKSAASASIE